MAFQKQIRYFRLGAGNPAIGLRQNARCDAQIRLPIVLRKQLDGYPRGANEFSLQGYVTNDLPAIWVAEIAGCRIVSQRFSPDRSNASLPSICPIR